MSTIKTKFTKSGALNFYLNGKRIAKSELRTKLYDFCEGEIWGRSKPLHWEDYTFGITADEKIIELINYFHFGIAQKFSWVDSNGNKKKLIRESKGCYTNYKFVDA